MKRIVLFGAGQVGAFVLGSLDAEYEVLCFADSNPDRQGSIYCAHPVLPIEEALGLNPECVFLCAVDESRRSQMEEALRKLYYQGLVRSPCTKSGIDCRYGVMRLLARQLQDLNIPGDLAELGVYRGDFASAIASAFSGRTIHLFDTFEGFSERDLEPERSNAYSAANVGDFSGTDPELVLSKLRQPGNAIIHKGYFPDTFIPCLGTRFVFVSVDADLYLPTKAALPLFYDRLSPGGAIMVHDVIGLQYKGVAAAVNEFCKERRLFYDPVGDLHGSAIIRKPFNSDNDFLNGA